MESKTKNIKFLITHRCNFKCTWCHNEFQGNFFREIYKNKGIFDAGKVKKLISILKNAGYDRFIVKFSGGEPLLNKNEIFNILKFLKNVNILKKILITNLSLADHSTLLKIVQYKFDEVRVNIPSFNPSFYSKITNSSDIFLFKAIKNCCYLIENGIHIRLNVVLNPDILKDDPFSFINDYIKASKKALNANYFAFIIDDKIPEKKRYFYALRDKLEIASSEATVYRRKRIFEAMINNKKVAIILCSDWEKIDLINNETTDLYVLPPGEIMRQYLIK